MTGLLRSWIEAANAPDCDFPLNNLPYGSAIKDVAPHLGEGAFLHCVVAIGDMMLDVTTMEADGKISCGEMAGIVLDMGDWTNFMALGPETWKNFRSTLTDILKENSPHRTLAEPYLVPRHGANLVMPFHISEFTDFYASRHHATNVGTMFRGAENALPPNWLHIPIGYNGRASSVVVSGTPIIRPHGQLKGPNDDAPRFGPSARFDIELELGAIVGQPSSGPISVAEAFENIFGYVLLNDWSARDIQAWEYQPLGPFQAKATATTISPWIVTAEALAPFRVSTPARDVPLLPYLGESAPMLYDVALEVGLAPEGKAETIIARANYSEMYYSSAQQLAHHTSSGCPMRVGDLLGSGTISGPERENRGSLLELSWGGKEPFILDTGESRSFIEDGDTITLRGHAAGNGYRIGFGECVGQVLPARR
ncbi:MAG: fumarylacetoacetase [Paracoccaceae bacterium]|nr:fumarylacetoacetase [Paracoccaceae bacterium]